MQLLGVVFALECCCFNGQLLLEFSWSSQCPWPLVDAKLDVWMLRDGADFKLSAHYETAHVKGVHAI